MCASHLLNRWLHGASSTGEQEMVQVSLEQIQPFYLNPRVTRNPGYDVLKASILARGLDNPPVLTRRPGDEKYMLASGGNTRLAILNELWQETQDERYHRVCWPFRPWPETLSPQQGEVQCLIGHLAESDLHNGLMFIERAEGILHLRDLYHEAGIECLTQLALAEQLTRDGYPVSQSQISRMLQTVDWLLPCIPNALYSGLTRKVIDRLLALRSAAEQVWAKLMPMERQPEFADLFSTALATFDGDTEAVVPPLVQDELLGEMSSRSGISWNTLLAELTDGQSKRQALLKPGSNIQFARFLHLFDGHQKVFHLHFGDVATAIRGKDVKLVITQHPLLMFRRPIHVTGYPFACHRLEHMFRRYRKAFCFSVCTRIDAGNQQ
nr:ParB family protein [Enterobacter ludwigii]